MKIRVTLFLLLLFMALPLSGCRAEEAKNTAGEQNKTKVEPYVWDLGRVKKNGKLERSFIFKNESGRVLTISGVNTSCGCTGSEIKDKILKPGQKTRVKVKFDSKGYAAGKINQYVYINTDDPKNPVLKFTVKIEVVEDTTSIRIMS